MIRRAALIELLAVLVIAGCDRAQPDEEEISFSEQPIPIDFIHQDNPRTGVSLRTPADWKRLSADGTTMRLFGPDTELGRPTLSVLMTPGPADSLEKIEARLLENLPKQIPNFSLVADLHSASLAGQPAIRLTYTGRVAPGEPTTQWMQTIAYEHGKWCIFTFAAPASSWTRVELTGEQIVGSSRFK